MNEELLIWVDGKNWTKPLMFSCYDDNTLKDSLLGQCEMSVTKLMGPAYLPMLTVKVKIPLKGITVESFTAAELECVCKALSEVLDEEEDSIEDIKVFDRPENVEEKIVDGCVITFSLSKELLKSMNINDNFVSDEDWRSATNKLWKYKKYLASERSERGREVVNMV